MNQFEDDAEDTIVDAGLAERMREIVREQQRLLHSSGVVRLPVPYDAGNLELDRAAGE